jgi:hypothetical protein
VCAYIEVRFDARDNNYLIQYAARKAKKKLKCDMQAMNILYSVYVLYNVFIFRMHVF